MKKKLNIEDKIWSFIDKHLYLVYFIIITLLSLIVRILFIKYGGGDYDMFLKPWFDELKILGGLPGLGNNIGNYTPAYMTILALLTYIPINSLISIKTVSILFDYIGGIFIIKIIMELLKNKEYKKKIALVVYTFYLFLPTVILNSSYWGQSDSIYTTFVIISLYYLIKKNFIKGILFWAIAFSFKFQAIFIFPLYVLMYFTDRKIKFKYFLIMPLVVFAFSLPKVIYSHNILAGFDVYYNQAGTYDNYLTLNLPNCYSIFLNGYDGANSNLIDTRNPDMGKVGIIATLAIFITISFMVYKNKVKFDKQVIIDFALWSILICNFFLPQMHERYLFMADVIGLIYLVCNRKKYYIPIAIELISLNGYMYLLFSGFAVNFSLLSIFYLVILIIFTKDMYVKYFKNVGD